MRTNTGTLALYIEILIDGLLIGLRSRSAGMLAGAGAACSAGRIGG